MSLIRYNPDRFDNKLKVALNLPDIEVSATLKSLIYKAGMNNIEVIEKRLKEIETRQAAEMEKLAALFTEVVRTQMEKFAKELENVDTHVSEEEQGEDTWGKF